MTLKRRLRKIANTHSTIKRQYKTYPNLDEIIIFIYLPSSSGKTKKLKFNFII